MLYTDEEFAEVVASSRSKSDICRYFNLPINGSGLRKVNGDLNRLQLDTSHFLKGGEFCRKWKIIEKECPVCKTKFTTRKGHPREQQTCSYGCSNTLFRSGKRNGRHKHGGYEGDKQDPAYRAICFKHYKQECTICGWGISVDVHHIDGDHNNDDPSNLIPLCPNHHRMAHMREYKDQINKILVTHRDDSARMLILGRCLVEARCR